MLLTPHGAKFHSFTKKYYFEGHPSQFLALLTHSNLPVTHQFLVQGKVVTLSDMLNNTMKEVNTKEEVTWVLWALQQYLSPDATWYNHENEFWSIERLVQIESGAPVVGAPCGGNHRLFALTRARDKYLKLGNPLRGVWLQADQKIKQHIEIARSLQNSDGSFSSAFYKGPMHTNDVNERFNTTGHTMEFLSIALPEQRLHEQWVRNAVWTLSRELVIHRDTQIDCGPLFHSLDALILYRDRIRPKAPQSDQPVLPPQALTALPGSSATPALKPHAESVIAQPAPTAAAEIKAESTKPMESKPSATDLMPMPNEVKPTPNDVKPMPVEQKPETTELKPVPEQAKPAPVEPQPSTDASEPVLEKKPTEPESGKTVRHQVPPKATRLEFTKSRPAAASKDRPLAKDIPRIDPSLLSGVGQAAPVKYGDKLVKESKQETERNPLKILAPELLPDASATPLTTSELPKILVSPGDAVVKGATSASDAPVKDLASLIPPMIDANRDDDEPVSALTPENSHSSDE
jgi:hypothetical protein